MSDDKKGIYLEKSLIVQAVVIAVLLCVVSFIGGRLSGLSARGAKVETKRVEAQAAKEVPADSADSYMDTPKVTAADRIPEDETAVKSGEDIEQPTAAPATYEAVMNTTWEFKSGERISKNAYVENSKSNKNAVYFTLVLDDYPDSVICKSKKMKPGDSMYKVELVSALPDGEYKGEVTYHILDGAGNEAGTVKTGVQLVVGK